jgi:hypothetical protein
MADIEHLDLFDAGRGPQFDNINIAMKRSPRGSRGMGFGRPSVTKMGL